MDEKKKILKMVEDGKITAQEALDLIEAIGRTETEEEKNVRPKGKSSNRMFRIRIDAAEQDGRERAKVNINIPLNVARKLTSLTKMIPDSAKEEMAREGVNIDELNLSELLDALHESGSEESLVDIDATDGDGKGGAKVKIYVD
ncbi:MAG: hypothetical protein JXN10_07105 [Clostridia bacterium]|nr:hypothetical protein [Clostridia bacterium]MBN2883279.1 hypothetical protein [Clostridia bacterium]